VGFSVSGDSFNWEPECYLTADMITAPNLQYAARARTDAVGRFLREFLAAGPQRRGEVLKRARARGFSESTLDRAAEIVGIVHPTHGLWALPAETDERTEDDRLASSVAEYLGIESSDLAA
jgi:hypothetical protein